MIANYGYKDGSGEYYISIDTDKCIDCAAGRACLEACPKQMFEVITDDYDDEVIWVKKPNCRTLAYDCSAGSGHAPGDIRQPISSFQPQHS